MAGKAARQATTVVEDEAERDFTIYADKKPTGTMEAFADWLIEEVGLEFATKKEEHQFREGVRLGGTLRMEFQGSEYWRTDERNPRSPAGKQARAYANGAAKEETAKPARRGRAAKADEGEDVEAEQETAKPARRTRAASAQPATASRRSSRRGARTEEAGEGTAAPY